MKKGLHFIERKKKILIYYNGFYIGKATDFINEDYHRPFTAVRNFELTALLIDSEFDEFNSFEGDVTFVSHPFSLSMVMKKQKIWIPEGLPNILDNVKTIQMIVPLDEIVDELIKIKDRKKKDSENNTKVLTL